MLGGWLLSGYCDYDVMVITEIPQEEVKARNCAREWKVYLAFRFKITTRRVLYSLLANCVNQGGICWSR